MKKKKYMAPTVELLEARVEKGFVVSSGSTDSSNGGEQVTNSGNNYGEGYLFS